jgi:hypothetical protein
VVHPTTGASFGSLDTGEKICFANVALLDWPELFHDDGQNSLNLSQEADNSRFMASGFILIETHNEGGDMYVEGGFSQGAADFGAAYHGARVAMNRGDGKVSVCAYGFLAKIDASNPL